MSMITLCVCLHFSNKVYLKIIKFTYIQTYLHKLEREDNIVKGRLVMNIANEEKTDRLVDSSPKLKLVRDDSNTSDSRNNVCVPTLERAIIRRKNNSRKRKQPRMTLKLIRLV